MEPFLSNDEVVDIVGFPNYQVSNQGFIISKLLDRPLEPYVDEKGRESVQLYRGGISHKKYVHRLVAEAFVKKDSLLQNEVLHIDGDLSNNVYTNLVWVTHEQLSNFQPGKHPFIIDETTGDVYATYTDAARSIEGRRLAVYYCCIGIQSSHKGHKFSFCKS